MNPVELSNRFTYHKPDSASVNSMKKIRDKAYGLCELINDLVPDSREKSLAITKLEEVSMWANAGIARNQPEGGRDELGIEINMSLTSLQTGFLEQLMHYATLVRDDHAMAQISKELHRRLSESNKVD